MLKKNWHVQCLTLFPEMFPGPLGYSLAGKALEKGIWSMNAIQIRDYALNKHAQVDASPTGGGVGMVMRPDVLGEAIDRTIKPGTRIIYPSPRGRIFTQKMALEFATMQNIAILCGRFEGIDQRVIDAYDIEEVSVGDIVLSGGEIAAFTIMDACIRLLPGVIGKKEALEEESFGANADYAGLLEYPLYTEPRIWRGRKVPEVLLSGHHAKIATWRLEQAKAITKERRKDLWERFEQKELNDE